MNLTGKVAVIDMDDTLSGFRYVLMETMNRLFKKDVHFSQWNILSMEHVYGVSNDEFIEIAKKEMLIERSAPHPETKEFMTRLFDAGIETHILTAREWHPRGYDVTRCWLEMHNIWVDKIKTVGLDDSKADYIKRMNNVLFTIDDSLRHCNSFARMTTNRPEYVFAYAMPWNTTVDESVIRINNLNDVVNYIDGL